MTVATPLKLFPTVDITPPTPFPRSESQLRPAQSLQSLTPDPVPTHLQERSPNIQGKMSMITRITHHSAFANPAVSLGLSAFSLLLLVLVLLSVPGPIKGLYWFSIQAEQTGEGNMNVGVLGWCCKLNLDLSLNLEASVS